MRVESVNNYMTNFKNKSIKINDAKDSDSSKSNNKLTLALTGLAIIGAGMVGVKNFKKISYEEALKRNGVQIKDGIATLISSGERYTGKIKRISAFNEKETVEFVNGVTTELLYHDLFGKELRGAFYQEGKEVLRLWQSLGQVKGSYGFSYITPQTPLNINPCPFIETKEGFAWARDYLKNKK